jgi:dolichol-phosphate mannosyltransferase|tara:strand:+ start:442 stop:1149 length:708 start_codon:yes stop_codon:yes gene_type:complete
MSFEKKILVFTATYNEYENIVELIKKIKNQKSKPDLLIIDDNSPDNTSEKVLELQKEYNNLFLIKRDGKLGLDSAHKEGYQYALKNNYDYLITMDADFSHDPNEIKNFIHNLENFPFVIGSRYIEGGKCLMKKRRLFISKYGNLLIKSVLKINCKEYTSSYRGFNLKTLNNFSLDLVKTKGYSFFMGTVFEINKRKFNIKQIPIVFADRAKGYSKIPKLEIFRTLKNLLILFFKK